MLCRPTHFFKLTKILLGPSYIFIGTRSWNQRFFNQTSKIDLIEIEIYIENWTICILYRCTVFENHPKYFLIFNNFYAKNPDCQKTWKFVFMFLQFDNFLFINLNLQIRICCILWTYVFEFSCRKSGLTKSSWKFVYILIFRLKSGLVSFQKIGIFHQFLSNKKWSVW